MNVKKCECANNLVALDVVLLLSQHRVKCFRAGSAVVFTISNRFESKVNDILKKFSGNIFYTDASRWDIDQIKVR